MHCFIPFSEVLIEEHPELMDSGLVPYSEEYRQFCVAGEIMPVVEADNQHERRAADLAVQKHELQKN